MPAPRTVRVGAGAPQVLRPAVAKCPTCQCYVNAVMELLDGYWYVHCPACGKDRWKVHAPGGHTQARHT